MPNGIAYLMLLLWPGVCLVLFRNLRLERALIWSIMGGYLFLPPLAEFNLPLVPGMDKVSIPNLSVLLILAFAMPVKLHLWPSSRIAQLLVVGLVLSVIPTVMNNGDPITFGVLRDSGPISFVTGQLPGQSIRDIGSVLISQMLTLVPFLLARQFLSTEEGLREMLLALMVGGLVYSIPSLIEIRLSPQMNTWIYGFFQHSFAQTIRAGGYRPIVFLPHGLWLALFMCTALMAAAALARVASPENRVKLALAVGYLAVLLVLCKSLAALAYGIVLTPLVLFAPARMQIRVALIFAVIAVVYPMLRNAGAVPVDAILEQAEAISVERAESLAYRFDNEEQMLTRAAEKPLFGWGGWGRNLVRDPVTGAIVSIPDGRWIIVFGTFGWVGYICEFGLLALPLLLMGGYAARNRQTEISPYIAPMMLILGITMMDMLLNATLTPLTWLTAGAILGYVEKLMPHRRGRPRHLVSAGQVLRRQSEPQGKRTIL